MYLYGHVAKDKGLVRVTPPDVARYWKHLTEWTSWASTHPSRGLMPVGIHGDDGQYNEAGDAITLVTLNFPLERDNDSILTRFRYTLFGFSPKSGKSRKQTSCYN